jgi:hypothetical protein
MDEEHGKIKREVGQPGEDLFIGNARDDIGIFRGTSGLWVIRGVTRAYFGGIGDVPVTR